MTVAELIRHLSMYHHYAEVYVEAFNMRIEVARVEPGSRWVPQTRTRQIKEAVVVLKGPRR